MKNYAAKFLCKIKIKKIKNIFITQIDEAQ